MAPNESAQFASYVHRHVRWLHRVDPYMSVPDVLEKLIRYSEMVLDDPRSIACLREMFLELHKQRASLPSVI
jgi:hypothetical protein